jgi:hypothetical protein
MGKQFSVILVDCNNKKSLHLSTQDQPFSPIEAGQKNTSPLTGVLCLVLFRGGFPAAYRSSEFQDFGGGQVICCQ